MIDEKRNERFWQACGWLVLDNLPDPSDHAPFTGLMLRYALPKVREKLGKTFLFFGVNDKGMEQVSFIGPAMLMQAWGESDTLSEAMFLAFEQALLAPQDSQQAG